MNSKLVGGAPLQAVRGNRIAESMSSARAFAQRPARSVCELFPENDHAAAAACPLFMFSGCDIDPMGDCG